MRRIDEMFNVHRARSGLFIEYTRGDVAYVGNGLGNNAVAGFVTPLPGDKVFRFRGIAVSAFCEATVQVPPFIACGRAGNGLTVLEPKGPMSAAQLAYIAAYINTSVRWRFSWYRQTTANRIGPLVVPDQLPRQDLSFDVRSELPSPSRQVRPAWAVNLSRFAIGSLYRLVPGDYHSLANLDAGPVPVVSCGDENNGISGYCRVREHLYQGRLTIALNGMNTLTAKYHPYQFAAKDDVAVCFPKTPMRWTSEVFIQVMLNRERWRYSYYRKCFVEKLCRVEVLLLAKNGALDQDTMERVVAATPYWEFLNARLGQPA
jgi:hypothetical protein